QDKKPSLEGVLKGIPDHFLDRIQQGEDIDSEQELVSLGKQLAVVKSDVARLNKLFPTLGNTILGLVREKFGHYVAVAATLSYIADAAEGPGSSQEQLEGLVPQLAALKSEKGFEDKEYWLFLSYVTEFGQGRAIYEVAEEFEAVVVDGFLGLYAAAGEKVVGLAYTTRQLDNGDWAKRHGEEQDTDVRGALEFYRRVEQQYSIDAAAVEKFVEESGILVPHSDEE
ncbi:hypothetical protein KY329_04265, partial [Candidatus Woesearchaeota archaeon]|nr:hypothetical protein [Candidatus Woesearchaeota archaeon]